MSLEGVLYTKNHGPEAVPQDSVQGTEQILNLSMVLIFLQQGSVKSATEAPKCSVQGSKKAQMRTENEKSIPIFLEQGLRVRQDH